METNALVEKVKMLPAPLKKEVEDFVDFLIYKNENLEVVSSYGSENEQTNINSKPTLLNEQPTSFNKKAKRQFGVLKGKIKIADNFDEPLEDFKDYM